MAMSDRLLAAWYEGHPALTLLRPLEWLYRRVVVGKRERFLAGEGQIYQPPCRWSWWAISPLAAPARRR